MKRIVTALLLSILVLCAVPISALASSNVIDVNAVCTLNLEYMDTKQPMDGVQFLLYRVADVDADMKFSWTHTFEEYGLNPDPKQALSLSRTLAAYVARDGLSPTDITVTDTTGKATFSGLNTGMYLLTSESYTTGGVRYTPVPTLVFFPFTGPDGTWGYQADIEVKFEQAPVENVSVKVLKVWDDDHAADRPGYIDVQLICDNYVYDEVRLSDKNSWRFVWDDLERGHYWEVIEKEVPDGYYSSTEIEGITFVITNTAKTTKEPPKEPPKEEPPKEDPKPEIPDVPKPDVPTNTDPKPEIPIVPQAPDPEPEQPEIPTPPAEEKLPQTGMNWDPVIYMASTGIVCMLLGLILRRKTARD